MNQTKEKKIAASLSILSNFLLIAFKLASGIISGSISIISEAVHSMSDFLASAITFFAVSRSSEPPDDGHPFGHGRYEDVSGALEGLLIIAAAFYIIWEALNKLLFGYVMEPNNTLGIITMLIAVIVNIFVSSYLFKVAKKTNSISLFADAEHLRTDVISSFGVLIGLVLIKITGLAVLDPLIAIIVAIVILRAGLSISKKSFNNLLDCSLPQKDCEKIKEIIAQNTNVITCKDIKSRQVGSERKFEIVLAFDGELSLNTCHEICNEIEMQIKKEFENSKIIIHQEPYIK